MAAVKLIPYTIRIHPQDEASEEDLWDLADLEQYNANYQSRLDESGEAGGLSDVTTFTDLFNQFCERYEEEPKDLGEIDGFRNKTFALSEDRESSDTVIEGNLFLGDYGVVRNLLNRQSGDRRERARDVDDSEEKPLYFLVYTPPQDAKRAHLIMERSRRYGAKEPFAHTLRNWIRDNYSDEIMVKIDPVTTDEIFPRMREADRTVRLRFEKDGKPGELHSDFDPIFDADSMKQAIEFRPESGEDMELIVDELEAWYNDPRQSFETIDGETYSNVKITVEKNDSNETISLTKGEVQMRKNIDLSDISEEGDIPALRKISSRAHGFLSTIKEDNHSTDSQF
jgi:hypothetical protein